MLRIRYGLRVDIDTADLKRIVWEIISHERMYQVVANNWQMCIYSISSNI